MSKYCTKCGKVSDDGAAFCDKCGQRFAAPPQGYSQPYRPNPPQPQKKSRVGLIVGICVPAVVLLIAALGFLAFFLFKRPNTPPVTLTYPTVAVRGTTPQMTAPAEKPTEMPTEMPTDR